MDAGKQGVVHTSTSTGPSKQLRTELGLTESDTFKRKHATSSTDLESEQNNQQREGSSEMDVENLQNDPFYDCDENAEQEQSSTSMSSSFMDESTVKLLIKNALDAAVKQLRTDLTALVKQTVTPLCTKMAELETENSKLKANIGTMHEEIVEMRQLTMQCQSELNDLQQYTRKSNVRVFGVNEEFGENCKTKVNDILKTKLHLKLGDDVIEVAHRAGLQRDNKARGILVRFHRRDTKYTVMKARKQLRGTGISISEDLTTANLRLLKDTKGHPRIEDVWGWNAKVFAKGVNGKTFVVRRTDNIDELLDIENKGE